KKRAMVVASTAIASSRSRHAVSISSELSRRVCLVARLCERSREILTRAGGSANVFVPLRGAACLRAMLRQETWSFTNPAVRRNHVSMKIVTNISQFLLGLIFLVFGLNGFLHFIPMPPPSGVAGQFLGAMFVSKYLLVVSGLQVISGALLLII